MAVLAYWQRINNFGDALTPWLVERITGKTAVHVSPADPRRKLVAAGSILRDACFSCVVWGAGALSMREVVRPDGDYRAVRGPLSRKLVLGQGGNCPEVYGDPGLLVPQWVPPEPTRVQLGIVPHYVDYEVVWERYMGEPGVRIINVRNGVEAIARQISSCEVIASSSLHGLVLAVAYGIPHVHLTVSNKLAGDGMKFADFYAGVGIEERAAVDCRTGLPNPGKLASMAMGTPFPDLEAFWAACPIGELGSGAES